MMKDKRIGLCVWVPRYVSTVAHFEWIFWIVGACVCVCFCLSNRMLSRLEMDTSRIEKYTHIQTKGERERERAEDKKGKAANVMNSMQLILKNIIAND